MIDSVGNKVSSLVSNIGKTNDLELMESMRSELMNTEAARAQNLMESKMATQMSMQQNQELALAANLMADGSGVGPNTNQMMAKYMKPGSTVSKSSKSVGGNTVINNITTNNNNIMPAPQGGGDNQGSVAKLKSWIQGVFSRQQQALDQRNKEYEKREWSLTRSSNKLMRAISSVGKTISTNLDPRKVSTFFGSQMKTVLFLFGLHFLSKAWPKVLGFINKAESAFNWMMGSGSESGKDEFSSGGFGDVWNKRLIKFFGGDISKDKNAGIALKNLFTEAMDQLGDRLDAIFRDRADAIKKVKFPPIKFSATDPTHNLINAFSSLSSYLKDILAAMMGGNKGILQKQAVKDLDVNGAVRGGIDNLAKSALDVRSKAYENYRDFGIVQGGALAFMKPHELRKSGIKPAHQSAWNGLLPNAVDENGNLKQGIDAAYSQGLEIDKQLNTAQTRGIINPVSMAAGLARLMRASEKSPVYLPETLVDRLPKEVKNSLLKSGDLVKITCKFVNKQLKESDLNGSYLKSRHFYKNNFLSLAGGWVGYQTGSAAHFFNADGILDKSSALLTSGLPNTENKIGAMAGRDIAAIAQYESAKKDALANSYYTLVPITDPLPGLKDNNGKELRMDCYKATTKAIREVAKYILKDKFSDDLNINEYDTKYLNSIQAAMVERAKLSKKEVKNLHDTIGKYSDTMANVEYTSLDRDLDAISKKYSGGRLDKFSGNVSDMATGAINSVKSLARSTWSAPWGGINVNPRPTLGGGITGGQYPNTEEGRMNFARDMYSHYIEAGIPHATALALTAQDAVESAWGTSRLAKYFNYGGMNIPGNNPNNSKFPYLESTDDGRSYKVALGSMADHVAYKLKYVILPHSRRALEATTPAEALNIIQSGGYASDPNYVRNVLPMVASVEKRLSQASEHGSSPERNLAGRSSVPVEDFTAYPSYDIIEPNSLTASSSKSSIGSNMAQVSKTASPSSTGPILTSSDSSNSGGFTLGKVDWGNSVASIKPVIVNNNNYNVYSQNHQTVKAVGRETPAG